MRRRIASSVLAMCLAVVGVVAHPRGGAPAGGEGEFAATTSPTSGLTGSVLQVTGSACYLPPGTTGEAGVGADGVLIRFVAPNGQTFASGTVPVERDGTVNTTFTVPARTPVGTYTVVATCIAPMMEDLGQVDAGTFEVTGEGANASIEREPATPQFPREIEPYPAYDGQSTCSPAAKPGTIAFRDMIMDTYPGTANYGISRDCSIGGTSEHKEGRAWDWGVNANDPDDRRKVDNLMAWLFRTDRYGHRHAMARRLGIMYIIWNRRIFRMYRPGEGWSPYSGSSAHTDHVHFSLTRAGGNKRTSFWTMDMPGPGEPPPPSPPPQPRPPRGDRATFQQTARAVDGEFDWTRVGDFDGDGQQDILWFRHGSGADVIWWGRPGRGFAGTRITVAGRLQPVVGDFNGDGRSDTVWYGRGNRRDHLWFGGTGRGDFTRRRVAIDANYGHALVGDFDGDGRDDIFWYTAGSGPDRLWWGRPNRTFSGVDRPVSGSYRPVAGDFDGDGRHDIFWYGPGGGADHLWFGKANRDFTATNRNMPHDQTPIAGDFNGNGRDDVFFYSPGSARDRLWWGRPNRTFLAGSVENVNGTYRPFSGDFDENRHDDIFWYGPGSGPDYIWWFN
jgi:hypothetical protein